MAVAAEATVAPTGGHRQLDRPPVAVAYDPVTTTNAANRDYAQPVFAALDGPITQMSNGFVGSPSDGLTHSTRRTRSALYPDCPKGNVVQAAQSGWDDIGTAARQSSRWASAQPKTRRYPRRSSLAPASSSSEAYKDGWNAYDAMLKPRPRICRESRPRA